MKYTLEPANAVARETVKNKYIDLKTFENKVDAEEYAEQIESDYDIELMVVETSSTVVDCEAITDSIEDKDIRYAEDTSGKRWEVKPIYKEDKLATLEDEEGTRKKVLVGDLYEFYNLYNEKEIMIWDCSEYDDGDGDNEVLSEDRIVSYLLPKNNVTRADYKMMNKYNLDIVGETKDDYEIEGTYSDLKRYMEDYIGVEIVEEYLYEQDDDIDTNQLDEEHMTFADSAYDISEDTIELEYTDGDTEEIILKYVMDYIDNPREEYKSIYDKNTGEYLYVFEDGYMSSSLNEYIEKNVTE